MKMVEKYIKWNGKGIWEQFTDNLCVIELQELPRIVYLDVT